MNLWGSIPTLLLILIPPTDLGLSHKIPLKKILPRRILNSTVKIQILRLRSSVGLDGAGDNHLSLFSESSGRKNERGILKWELTKLRFYQEMGLAPR